MVDVTADRVSVIVEANLNDITSKTPQAVRVYEQGMSSIEKSSVRAEGAIARVGDGMGKTGGASRVLGQQLSQVGQQALANGNVFQAFAIQLPDIAVGLSSAGGAAGRFAAALSGPLGTAVVLATSVAAAFIPQLLGIGDSADESAPKVDRLTEALKRLHNEQANEADIGEVLRKVNSLQEERLKLSTAADSAATKGERAQNNIRRRRIAEINEELGSLDRQIKMNDAVVQSRKDASEWADKQTKKEKTARAARTGKPEAPFGSGMEEGLRNFFFDQQQDLRKFIEGFGGDDAMVQKAFEIQDRLTEARIADEKKVAALRDDMQRAQIRSLATLYEDLFRGGSRAIWQDFKSIGLAVISQVLAQFTASRISGGGFDLGSALNTAIGGAFGLPGFASGGSFVVKGRGGSDRNVLSLNGKPIANVSRGETVGIGNRSIRGGAAMGGRQYIINVDASNSVNPDGFERRLTSTILTRAAQMDAQSARGTLQAVPARLARFQNDGT